MPNGVEHYYHKQHMSGFQKNTSGQKWLVFAFDTTSGVAETGDAANITAKISKDYAAAAATNDTNPTEVEDGYYLFDLTQAETNADVLFILPESSTANIQVVGCPSLSFNVSQSFANMSKTTIADQVWDEARADHTSAGSFGESGQVVRSGTAQAGASSSVTLDASASGTDDLYNNAVIWLRSGTGAGQVNTITDYVGSSKVATVSNTWATTPDATSVFVIYPSSIGETKGEIADAVWDEPRSGHSTSGTFGETVTNVNTKLPTGTISDVTTAQVNAEVLDVINVDTFSEPGSVPAATASLVDMLHWVFTVSRNKLEQTASVQRVRNDADSGNIATASVSDDGTTTTRGEFA